MSVRMNNVFIGAEKTMGTVEGIIEAASSKLVTDDIVRMFYANMVRQFEIYAGAAARANPGAYGHMYDWNMLGFKSGKLWKDIMIGPKGQRKITFTFLPSVKAVPATTANNTGISKKDFPNLSDRTYKFPNKAMVFELGKTVTIKPKNHDRLFVPLKHKTRSGWKESRFSGTLSQRDIDRGFVWAKKTVQDHSDTAGKFTGLYLAFYETQAERVFEEKVAPRVNNRIRKVYTYNVPSLGGSTLVAKKGSNTSRRFNIAAVVNHKSRVHNEFKKEMRLAVAEAQRGLDNDIN